MHALKVIRALGPIDARNVGRDAMLRWMAALPLVIAVAVRWLLPILIARLEALTQIVLTPYMPLVLSYGLLLLMPMLAGMVIGFLLLDQRDDQTLTALQVTPLPLSSYLAYRLGVPMLLSVALTLLTFPLAGLMTDQLGALLVAALAAAPLASIAALALAAFAANKVQGFALMKASGVFVMAPLIAAFVPSAWQLVFGIVPTYWPARLIWALQTADADAWVYLLVGLAYQALLLLLLLRRFERVMHR